MRPITTRHAGECRKCAAAIPAGPDPTTAMPFPVRCAGTSGLIQPSAQPRSTMLHSMDLMVTGLSSMLRVHASSQGAGHMRPVNSGKLLVECSVSNAVRH